MKRLLINSLFIFCLITSLQAQVTNSVTEGLWPTVFQYNDKQPAFRKDVLTLTDEKGENVLLNNVILNQVEKDLTGTEHYRYSQNSNGILIENASWIVHAKNGKVISQNGKLVKTFPADLKSKPMLKAKAALLKATEFVGAEEFKWENKDEEDFLKKEQNNPNATFYPKADLVYYSGENELTPSALRLAYKFDIYANKPMSRQFVFVDAQTGNVLGKRNLIRESNATGTAITAYSGTQIIVTDYTGSLYRLKEINRGTGNGIINTYNLQKGVNYSVAVDFTDLDNNWNNINVNQDEYATDAHWGTEKTYDYYLIKHNRNSIDNAGFPLNSYVHYSSNYFNAFWDGTRMTYGDGSSTNGYKPLTALDVCGHEITHGVTERTSNLVYSYESGAMNEGFSDIFGTAIEWYSRPGSADWIIGGDFYPIRSMSNPNTYSHPDTYLGTSWYTGSGDEGGVHTNSGVLNYWFYLLVNGGSGTNDHGVAYSVTGIGMTNAAAIAYLLNTSYLISTSTYADARILGIQAASNLFGPGSPQAIQTANAWTAVGLYAPTCADVTGLIESNLSEFSAQLNWDPTPGAVYYLVDYKLHSSATWINFGGTTSTHVSLSGLTSTTAYDWRVKSSCSANYSFAQFSTLAPECGIPGNLGATVNGTTVVLEWDHSSYAQRYHVEFKGPLDINWIDSGWVTTNSKTLSGLANNTLYLWRIESECSFDTSAYAQSQFLTDAASCGTPTGINVSYLPGLTTMLTWNEVPGAVRYRVQIKWPYGSWNGADRDEYITNDSLSIVGFMSGMNLDWRVRAECADNLSNYSVSTISTPCPAPVSISFSGITSSSATVTWASSGANSIFGYEVYYKLSTAASWTYATTTASTTVLLSGLLAGKNYLCQIRQRCYNFNSSYIQGSFTTLCSAAPSLLAATEVKTNGAKITWAAVPGAVSYTLQYKTAAATTFTDIPGITTTSYTFTGLTANTGYNYRVRTNCTIGTSPYTSTQNFTTYCISSGNNNNEWIDYFSLGALARGSSREIGGYIHTGLTTNLVIGSTGNAGQISAGFSGSTKKQLYAIYIDLNRNGSFADVGEKVVGTSTLANGNIYNFTLNVPPGASPGVTGLRVVMLREVSGLTLSLCLTTYRGETEDYFVNLTSPTAFSADEPSVTTEKKTIEGAGISVYPNPSDGNFTIEMEDKSYASYYEVFSMTGERIQEMKIESDDAIQLNISRQPAGIYFLRIIDTIGNSNTFKLIKQ